MILGFIRPKLEILGKINFMQKSQEIGQNYRIRISLCISVKVCTVGFHKIFKDIIYDVKLIMSKISKFGGEIIKFGAV